MKPPTHSAVIADDESHLPEWDGDARTCDLDSLSGDSNSTVARTRLGSSKWLADLSLISVALMWGINIPIMKYALGLIDPFCFNAFRLSISAVVLGLCVWWEMRGTSRSSGRKSYFRIACFALLSGFVYQYLFVVGIFRTTGGNTALIMSSMPMWTAVLAFFFIRERLSLVAWFGLLITFVGTLIVTLQKGDLNSSASLLWGNLIVLTAALAWAAATVMSRPVLKSISPIALAFIASATTLPLHIAVAAPHLREGILALKDPVVIGCLVYSGVFSTGISYAMWHYGVRQVGASHAATYQNLIPIVALAGGWMFLQESLLLGQIFGGLLIISGLIFMRRGRSRG